MNVSELREKLVAELAEVKPRAEALWVNYLEAKEEADRRMNEWSPAFSRAGLLERQLAALNALAEQLETKSPGSEPGADENTTEKKEP